MVPERNESGILKKHEGRGFSPVSACAHNHDRQFLNWQVPNSFADARIDSCRPQFRNDRTERIGHREPWSSIAP